MSDKYILVGQTPVPCEDVLEWARWFKNADTNRVVAKTAVGEHEISTVFLGLDHRFTGSGQPILFETMIFCHHTPACELDNEMRRYSEWLEAEAGHCTMVEHVRCNLNHGSLGRADLR